MDYPALKFDLDYPSLKFVVDGRPVAKGRPRFTSKGGHGRTYTPKKTENYEALVAFCVMNALSEYGIEWRKDGAYEVQIGAYFAIPKSKPKAFKEQATLGNIRPTTRPDVDNIAKIVCDALNGILWRDDSQVAMCYVEKIYDNDERLVVMVKDITHQDDRWTRKG